MIDPVNITDFSRSHDQLEELLLNAIAFAGKNARQQAVKMHVLLDGGARPFEKIRMWHADGSLIPRLVVSKIGKYRLLHDSYAKLAHAEINLKKCTVEELIQFPGVGLKTARLFLLHSRPNQMYVVIDTHVLKEMRSLGITNLKSPPTGRQYIELEQAYLAHLTASGVTDYATHDLATWRKYALARD
jgi:hypothetical protein